VTVDITKILSLLADQDPRGIGRAISLVENNSPESDLILASLDQSQIDVSLVLGITGPPGVGKSTLTGVLISHFREMGKRVGVVAVDPSSPISGGAILGDRVRMMEHSLDPDVVIRSMSNRGRLGGVCGAAGAAVRIMASSGCSIVIIETVGVGQSEIDVIALADITVMVTVPGMGDDIQAMKAGILEVADLIIINKADHLGADVAVMDMEAVLRERVSNSDLAVEVVKTVAVKGQGISKLADQIDKLNLELSASGERQQRRDRAHELEVFDWAMEMVRPKIKAKMAKINHDAGIDPKVKAKQLLKELIL
jgi:LAO/AO transport system kinase